MLDFKTEFERIFTQHNISYDVKGIITADKKIYSLGTDSKVLSTVFELLVRPVIYQIARQNGMIVREAKAQNYYPDFTLMESAADNRKIAVDVKTTYRSQERSKVSFTLGGYTSFIRNETKNIEFPYSQYAEEWVIGFIYTRKPSGDAPNHIYDLERLDEIPLPFEDVSWFVARKWKIAGESAGSGNTANIGSISGDLDDFRSELGPFRSKEEFLEYWRNYERTASEREGKYKNLAEFRIWRQYR